MALTNDNYFDTENAMRFFSVSQCKAFEKCEAAALAEAKGEYKPETTTALMQGSYIDAWFEGTLDKFTTEHPEMFKRDGNLKADFVKAVDAIHRVSQDKLFMEYMGGQKQVIMVGTIAGEPFKIKMDSYHPEDKIVDLKFVRSFERIMGRSFVDYWNYNLQGGCYRKIEAQNTNGCEKPFYLAAVTKEDPCDIAIIELDAGDMAEEVEHIEKLIPRWAKIKRGEVEPERCECCAYCRATKQLKAPIKADEVGFTTAQLKAMEV